MNAEERMNLYRKYIENCTDADGSVDNYSQFTRIDGWVRSKHPDFKGFIEIDDSKNASGLFDELCSWESMPDDKKPNESFKKIGKRQYYNAVVNYIKFLKCLELFRDIKEETIKYEKEKLKSGFPLQRILYGAPGTGKSYSVFSAIAIHLGIINEKEKLSDAQRKGLENANYIFRTTFHPDYDYAQFVGCYKPTKDGDGKITYEFTPQVFTNALVKAYESSDHVYLVIEEINRGNCAQIFGDIFQLLDRKSEDDFKGESEYSINVDEDLKIYLEEKCPNAINNGKIKLPRNFNIIATMNTSDQSLFPMDSAFKRRWEWQYVPVDLSDEVDSSKFEITIDGSKYKWHDFLRAVNVKIKDVTKSEDKQMGNFFIKKSVDAKEFCNKVMFYLWNDISKDYYESNDSLFQYKTGDGTKHFSFNELFGTKQFELLKGFMSFVGCEVSNSAKPEETTVSEEPQKEEDNN